MKAKRINPTVNAGSMADIAFLLLVFFLVVTTMHNEKGIISKLPPDVEMPNGLTHNRNVLEVLINAKDALLVENEPADIGQLKAMTVKHVDNHGKLPNFSDSPKRALVSVKNDRGTSYAAYLEVLNEIRAAYNEMRNAYAQRHYGLAYKDLPDAEQARVRAAYPLNVSEAEPDDYGLERE